MRLTFSVLCAVDGSGNVVAVSGSSDGLLVEMVIADLAETTGEATSMLLRSKYSIEHVDVDIETEDDSEESKR